MSALTICRDGRTSPRLNPDEISYGDATAGGATYAPDPGLIYDDHQNLRGFWNPVHAIPPPPRLVVGDPDKFKADLAACDARRKAIEDQAMGTRWTVIRLWL